MTCTVVQKYGGSSLASIDQIRSVAGRIAADVARNGPIVVVVSARGDTTDRLLDLVERLAAESPRSHHDRETDQLLSTGEIASAAQLAMALRDIDVPAISLSGPQAGIGVSGAAGNGVIDSIDPRRMNRMLADGDVVVVGGFQGLDRNGDVVTLGRGGSDTTAVALAVALQADRCEIYTDVDGVYTVDPRAVTDAKMLSHVDMQMITEMTFTGAKVLHPRAAELAAAHELDLYVGHAAGESPGTVVTSRSLETSRVISAITCDAEVARVLVRSSGEHDLSPAILQMLSRQAVPVDLVARSGPNETEFRMGFTIQADALASIRPQLLEAAEIAAASVVIDDDVSKISVIGVGLLNRPQYVARMTGALADGGISTSWVSLSQSRVSVTLPRDERIKAMRLLHKEFEVEDLPVDPQAPEAGWPADAFTSHQN